MSDESPHPVCPHCSSDILRPAPCCWLCGRPLPDELVERLVVEDVLRRPVTLAGGADQDSSHFGLIFLLACLAAGGFTVSAKFGWLFLALLLPAGLWLVMESIPAFSRRWSGAAWTAAALVVMPLGLIAALVSAGLAGLPGGSLLRLLR
ncbi:MAG: hypothetical protein PHU21_01265 [Elusimicrobia bacterium]|nr:hypothetical protein [Elusimicrobiota bacterium]